MNPASLEQAQRELIAKYLSGTDIKQLYPVFEDNPADQWNDIFTGRYEFCDAYVRADEPTLEALLTALQKQEERLKWMVDENDNAESNESID